MHDQAFWINEQEIVLTTNRYFRALDERNFDPDYYATLFTNDATVSRPNGTTLTGPAEIAKSHAESLARFKVTQHLLIGHDVEIDGDSATARINLVAIHLWKEDGNQANMLGNHFTAGTILTVGFTKQDGAWKISSLSNQAVWRDGTGIQQMAETDGATKS